MAEHGHAHGEHGEHGEHCGMERYTNTELVVRADILTMAKELAELISTSDEVQFYKQAEQKINRNEEVQRLISAIKKKQKEAVAFESFQNPKMVAKIEGEIAELQDQLDSIPIVEEFKQSQADINYLLQLIISAIKDTVSEKINVESGTATVTSCSD